MKKSQPKSEKSQLSRALAVLNRIGQSLIDVQELPKVLKQIAKDAMAILGADIVDLYEYNQAKEQFVLPPVMIGERWHPHVPKDAIYNDDVVVKVVRAGKPQYFSNAQKSKLLTGKFVVPRSDAPDQRFVIREGVFSSVSLPLKAGEETVGVMFVNYRTSQAFDDEQKNLIESFSNLAAIAIHNARLWKAQREQVQLREKLFAERGSQLDAIKEIVNSIGATSDPLPIILEQVAGLFAADHGAIGLCTPQTDAIQFYAIWEEGVLLTGDDIPADKRNISGKKSIMLHVAATGRPYRISDVRKDPHYRKWYAKTRSELAVPLKNSQGNVIGVLNLESTSLAAFEQADEEMCQGLANVISSVIEKSTVLNTTQRLHRQLELLHSVVGEQDLQRVLTLVLKGLNEIVGKGTSSSINLYDEASNALYNLLAIGELAENLKVTPREGGTCRYVITTREPLFVDDTQYELDHPPKRPVLRKEAVVDAGIKSFAALPLIRNERVLGVLFVHQKNLTKFTQDLQLVLDTFAKQAAIAIDTARREIDITDINKAIISNQPIDDILKLIITKAAQAVGVEYGSLWKEDPASGDLILGALFCPSENLVTDYLKRLPAGAPSVNMRVYQTGKPILLADVEKSDEGYHRIYKPSKVEIAVPLKYMDRTIGTLNVESDKVGIFSEYDVGILETFARQAAIAIMTAQTTEQRIKFIKAIGDINSALGSGKTSEIYPLIAEKAQELAVSTYSTLWILDEKNNRLKVGAVSGREALENTLPLDDNSINGYVATRTRRPYLCKDASQDMHYHPWYPEIQSNFTVPLLFGSELIGTLHVESVNKDAYLEHQQESLQLLGNHAASAIKITSLFEELMQKNFDLDRTNIRIERRKRSLLALTQVSQQLTSGIQLSEREILSIIPDQAERIMDTNNMFIAIYNPDEDEVRFELAFVDGKAVDTTADSSWGPRRGGKGRTEWIIRHKQPILNFTEADAKDWYQRPDAKEYIGETFASWIGAPMLYGDEVLGVIATYHKTDSYKYDRDDLDVLSIMARQAAIALKNTRLVQTLAKRVEELDALRGLAEELNALSRPG